MKRWKPEFDPTMENILIMAVWVMRLPGLPVEYFRVDVLKLILERVGKTLKLDRTTTVMERGKFARASVEIDLKEPLVSMVWVQKRLQRVEYEALHVICIDCGAVGHRANGCPNELSNNKPPQNTEEMEKGNN